MNDLQIFTYNNTPLRTVEKDGEIWWVLKDVCGVLGISNYWNVSSRLDDDEKALHLVEGPNGQVQQTSIVNEPGLYSVILRSDKPEAKDFKRWVTHEVLPSIRQKGSYSVHPMSPAQLIAAQAQILVEMEQKMADMENKTLALEEKVDSAIKVFSRPAEDHWKADMDQAIKALCQENHLSSVKARGQMYEELERTTGCSVNSRLSRLRTRKKKTGMRYKDIMALTKLDAIAADKQLRAVFEGILRKWQARAILPEGGENNG